MSAVFDHSILKRNMNIAIVVPCVWDSRSYSYDPGLLVNGFRELGHEAFVVYLKGSILNAKESMYRAEYTTIELNEDEMVSSEVWTKLKYSANPKENGNALESHLGIDLAVVNTWMGMPKLVKAMKSANIPCIGRGDTDGLLGVRVYPLPTLTRMFFPQSTGLGKLRATWHWVKKYCALYKQEDNEILQSVGASDWTMVETDAAKKHLQSLFRYHNRNDLDQRIGVIPNPVAESFIQADICQKQNKVVAVARWDDPQKNTPLLVQALTKYADAHPETQVVLIGRGGEKFFQRLTERFPNIRYIGVVPNIEVAQHLSTARSLLFSSRWEGSPVAGNEALALGCSIVGPQIPGIESICDAGPFGTFARKYNAAALAAALEQEMHQWERGERNPVEIAAFWRRHFSSVSVAAQYLKYSPAPSQHTTLSI